MNKDEKEPWTLAWKDVNSWTKLTGKNNQAKQLLRNISGIASSGSLTAILSPSGAGKTSLLAVLSRRFKDTVNGEILLNGRSISQEEMSNISGFVCQKDPTFENLSVEEHLSFAARLKCDKNLSAHIRQKCVVRIVKNLGLSHRMHAPINALSGGQRKRLALATQLITDPMILFCDEPTTGLDSYGAINVVQLLRNLANEGKMIICTIHQPASGIFELFDNVTLLASGGILAYHGLVTHVDEYFANLGMKCPDNYNLSDHVISQITIQPYAIEKSHQSESYVNNIVDKFRESKTYHRLEKELEASMEPNQRFVDTSSKIKHVPFRVEFTWLLWRSSLQIGRSYKVWLYRFLAYVFAFTCLSLPYGRIKINQTGVQNIQGFLHCMLLEILYSSMYSVTNTIPDELPVFVQESADKVYSPFSYYLSKLVVLSTKAVIEAYIHTTYAMAITGLNRKFSDYIMDGIPVILISLVSAAYGFFLSTAFESVTTFSLFSVPFELVSTACGGLIVKLSSLPPTVAWLKYISILFYAYEALAITTWTKHRQIPCEYLARMDHCKYRSGHDVLTSFSFTEDDLTMDYLGLIVYFLILHLLSFGFLLRKLNKSIAY